MSVQITPCLEGHGFLLQQKILPLVTSLDENVNSRGFLIDRAHLPPEGRRILVNVVKPKAHAVNSDIRSH